MIPSTRGGFVIVPESAPYVDMSDEELVLFGRNSSEVSPRAESVLDRLGATLSTGALSGYNVQIEGHTCNLGSTDYNQLLSEERARAVKKYLARKFGIDGTRIRSVGYGETRPKLENLSERDQANNRRVRVVRLEENDGNRVLTMAEFEESRARAVTRGVAGSLVEAELWGMSAGGLQLRPIQNGDAISSGGLLKVRIRVNEGCHIYVIAHSSTGKSTLLLPNPDEELANHGRWVDRTEFVSDSNGDLVLPRVGMSYQLDNNAGLETIVVFATRDAPVDMGELMAAPGTIVASGQFPEGLLGSSGEVEVLRVNHVGAN
jgi:hypothetical protein